MSLHYYSGPTARHGPSPLVTGLAWAFAALAIGLQIAFPLVDAESQTTLAIATVIAFYLASVIHAGASYGVTGVLLVGAAVPALGLLAEAVGVRTGMPFGDYTYGDALGAMVLDVPIVVPLAWAMMAYPTFIVASTLAVSRWWIALIGGWSLMAWDIFLDPMMVELDGWHWLTDRSALPGIPGIPLQNYAGWFVVGSIIIGVLTVLPRSHVSIAQPASLYLWVFASSVLGSVVFFDRPGAGWIGGIAMGVVALPFAWRVWDHRT